jgi:adenosine deaminase
LITDTTVTDEYLLAQRQWDLGIDELQWIMINGFKSAFLPFREKKHLLRKVIAEFDALVDQFSAPNKNAKVKTKATSAETSAEA